MDRRNWSAMVIVALLVSVLAWVTPAQENNLAASAAKNPVIRENSVVYIIPSDEDYARLIAKSPSSEQGLAELLSDYCFYADKLIPILRKRAIAASFGVGREISFQLSDGSLIKETLDQENVIALALFAKGKQPIIVRPPKRDEGETKVIRIFGDYEYTANIISEYFEIWLPPYKGQDIAWSRIREAYRDYSAAPSTENAERIIALLPDELDYRNIDQKELENTLDYLYLSNDEPFRVLEDQIRQGNELAIRVAFKTQVITDGAVTEDLLAIISGAIRTNTPIFLEELASLKAHDGDSVNFILRRDNDIDTYALEEDPPSREAFKKEILLRMKALKAVARPDLIEIRDYCLKKYEEMLMGLK